MKLALEGLAARVESSTPVLMVSIGGGDYQLRSESLVDAVDGVGGHWQADEPGEIGETLKRLIDGEISSVSVHEGGSLTLTMGSGARISFLPDPDFESWSLVGRSGFRLVCMPGGELAEWQPSGE